jgi:hypothetical protein
MRNLFAALFLLALTSFATAADVQNLGPTFGDVTSKTTPGVGFVGEPLSSSNATQAITTATVTNTLSQSIPAGHWRCFGSIRTNPAGGTTQSQVVVEVGTNSTPTLTNLPPEAFGNATAAGITVGLISGPWYFNFTTSTTVFVVAFVNYASSTLTINSQLNCDRTF